MFTILNAEKGLFRLVKGLTIAPGQTAAAFVEGKRKRYFNPFTFLALCLAIVVLMNNWLKPYGDPAKPDPIVMSRIADPHTMDAYLESVERYANIEDFTNKNMNLATVLMGPYFAFCLWIFFRKRQRNAAEIMVAFILFIGFATLVTSLLITPWRAVYRDTGTQNILLSVDILLQTLYITWGLTWFFNYSTADGFLKVFGALCLIGLIGFIFLMIALVNYMYQGSFFEVLKYLGGT